MSLSGTVHETTDDVTYTYCPGAVVGCAGSSVTVFKTTPGSYCVKPCSHAASTHTWQAIRETVAALEDVVWSTV